LENWKVLVVLKQGNGLKDIRDQIEKNQRKNDQVEQMLDSGNVGLVDAQQWRLG
jgi:hypothetical protein